MYKQYPLSLAYLTVFGCPPLDNVKIAAASGYDMASLRLIAPHGLELAHPIVGNAPLIREIKTVAADLDISFYDGEVFTLLPETDVESWLPVIETAAEFGMPIMQITCEDPDFSRAGDNLGRVADAAAKHDMRMAIEFMRWRSAATIQDAARLAAASGRDNVGILLDALHLSRSGGNPADVAALPEGLALYLQLCDAPAEQPADNTACIAEARTGRMFPGDGGLWLNELMAVLPRDIVISVETPHKGDSELSFTERAEKGMAATRCFLDALPA
jgi:sugar phosphate isomerase/epimerase